MPDLQTPHYLIDLARLRVNMERIQTLRQQSGAKCLLALKCFATWSVFDVMRPFMDGTTSSSLYELRLGHEEFGGETHAYSVAWADHEIDEAARSVDAHGLAAVMASEADKACKLITHGRHDRNADADQVAACMSELVGVFHKGRQQLLRKLLGVQPIAGAGHQRQVPVMQRAHRRHDGHSLS